MLAMADVSIDRFLPLFANTGVPVDNGRDSSREEASQR